MDETYTKEQMDAAIKEAYTNGVHSGLKIMQKICADAARAYGGYQGQMIAQSIESLDPKVVEVELEN